MKTYDDSDQLTSVLTSDSSGTETHRLTTTYDGRGFPATEETPEGVQFLTHDRQGRLVAVDHPDGAALGDESYGYDIVGRRVSSHRHPQSEVVHDDGDRLVQDAGYTYVYDAEGRRVSQTNRANGVVTSFSYDALDRLIGSESEGTAWTYLYDARGLRVLVRAEGAFNYEESFVYDTNGTVRAVYGDGGVIREPVTKQVRVA